MNRSQTLLKLLKYVKIYTKFEFRAKQKHSNGFQFSGTFIFIVTKKFSNKELKVYGKKIMNLHPPW